MSENAAEIGVRAARTASGLIVPVGAIAAHPSTAMAIDPDGRRRIVLSRAEWKQIERAMRVLAGSGRGMLVGCHPSYQHPDGTRACGEMMVPEAQGTPDFGYGCRCSRIHIASR